MKESFYYGFKIVINNGKKKNKVMIYDRSSNRHIRTTKIDKNYNPLVYAKNLIDFWYQRGSCGYEGKI